MTPSLYRRQTTAGYFHQEASLFSHNHFVGKHLLQETHLNLQSIRRKSHLTKNDSFYEHSAMHSCISKLAHHLAHLDPHFTPAGYSTWPSRYRTPSISHRRHSCLTQCRVEAQIHEFNTRPSRGCQAVFASPGGMAKGPNYLFSCD